MRGVFSSVFLLFYIETHKIFEIVAIIYIIDGRQKEKQFPYQISHVDSIFGLFKFCSHLKATFGKIGVPWAESTMLPSWYILCHTAYNQKVIHH